MLLSDQTIAIVVLVGLLLALAGWIVVALKRSDYSPVYAVLYFLNVLLTRVLWRTEVRGRLNIPPDRGAVIVCNHRSPVDPFFIQLVARRIVHWMVAAEYFKVPIGGPLLTFMEAIPTRRGGVDTASTRMVIRRAESAQLVGMLPEGRINSTPEVLLPGRPGAIMVALAARVPIVPCYIHGAPYDGTAWGCFFMTAHVKLVVGDPIDLSSHFDQPLTPELQAELTLTVMRAIARLGGHDEFEPTLAGRRWNA